MRLNRRFPFFPLPAKKNLLAIKDSNHQLLDKRLMLSISVSIPQNPSLKHLGACIFSHCIANPLSPGVSLSHKTVDAHFSNSLQQRLLYFFLQDLSPSSRSYCQIHHKAMTSPEALSEVQGGVLSGKTSWQKNKSSCKRQGAFLGSRREQMRNSREAVPNLPVSIFSYCN